MKRGKAIAAALVASACSAVATAESDHPSNGLLVGTKATHSLVYSCSPPEAERMECQFTQVMVRKKARPEDLPTAIDRAKNAWVKSEMERPSAEACKLNGQLIEVLEGRAAPTGDLNPPPSRPLEKQAQLAVAAKFADFCRQPSEERLLEAIRTQHAIEERTCMVASNSFSQVFKSVGSGGAWVTDSRAEGECGIVQLSRFEPDKTNDFNLWRYIARKAVTNPTGKVLPGMQCSDLDQAEYVYDWRNEPAGIGCDFIEFSAL